MLDLTPAYSPDIKNTVNKWIQKDILNLRFDRVAVSSKQAGGYTGLYFGIMNAASNGKRTAIIGFTLGVFNGQIYMILRRTDIAPGLFSSYADWWKNVPGDEIKFTVTEAGLENFLGKMAPSDRLLFTSIFVSMPHIASVAKPKAGEKIEQSFVNQVALYVQSKMLASLSI